MTTLRISTINWRKQIRLALHRLIEQRWINVGLREKMGAIVVMGLAGLLAIFALLGITTARQTTRQALGERLLLARMSAANLDANIRHIKSMLTVIADQEVLRNPQANLAEQAVALRTGFNQIAVFSKGVYLLDLAGYPVVSAVEKEEELDWSGLALTKNLDDKGTGLIKVPGEQSLAVIIVPLVNPAGLPLGFLAALLDLADPDIAPFKHPLDLGPTGTLDVVDSTGQILISSQPDQAGLNNSQSHLLETLLAADRPMVETCVGCSSNAFSETQDQILAFAPLSQVPWGVVIRQEADEVFAPVRRLTLQTIILGMVAVIGALGLVWVTTNSVVDPVQLLMAAAGRIAGGDLTTPICCKRGDEIGELAQSFDVMRAQLKRSMDEIQHWNRELDARVQERTQAALEAQLEAQRVRDDLRAIIDGLSDELVVIDLNYRVEQVNRATQRHYPGQKLVGQTCYHFLTNGQPCQSPPGNCPMGQVLATGEPAKATHTYKNPATGQSRYVDIVASPMRDAGGQITRIIELRRDVTEEKELEDSLVRRNQQLSIMNAVATTVNQSLDLEEILGKTLDEMLQLTDIDVGAIFLRKDRLDNLELVAHKGFSEEAARLAARLGLLDGSCGGVVETGQIVVVPDLSGYRGRRAESLKRENLQNLVHVPLVAKGCTLGSMCVAMRQQHEFDTEEQELLTALGNQLAVAIENARLYAEVQRKEQIRGELLKKIITVQEDERKRIARELHDDTSQALTALLYAAEEGMDMNDLAEVKDRLVAMRDLAGHTLDGVHKLIFDLRPTMLDHLGLVPALRWFAQSRLEPLGVRVTVEEQASTRRRLPTEVETALFRVVQEAIHNIARHSGSRTARVCFDLDDTCAQIRVEDDGLGFDVVEMTLSPDSRRGLGLMGMRERIELLGGELEVITAPGFGTQIDIHVPWSSRNGNHG